MEEELNFKHCPMVYESQYNGWFHTIDLAHDPTPLLEANSEEFKKLIKKKIDT